MAPLPSDQEGQDRRNQRRVVDLVEAVFEQRDGGLIDVIVRAAHAHLGLEVTFVSQFVGAEQRLLGLAGERASFGLQVGDGLRLVDSYCRRLVRGELPSLIPDARGDPLVKDLAVTAVLGIGAYVGVPVRLPCGELYGTLCCLSHHPCRELDQRDVRFMHVLAAVLAESLSHDPRRSAQRRHAAVQIASALNAGGITMAFQPIVDLADGATVGVEALARFGGLTPPRPPDAWFADAWEVGLGEALELVAVRSALSALPELPADLYLSINVDPRTAVSTAFARLLEDHGGGRHLLIELTEHEPVTMYHDLCATIRGLRPRNASFAVDDAGAGYSQLNHWVELNPDVTKLDRFLTAGVHRDPARRALLDAAVTFTNVTHKRLVAEGVEHPEELHALQRAGVRYGQGVSTRRADFTCRAHARAAQNQRRPLGLRKSHAAADRVRRAHRWGQTRARRALGALLHLLAEAGAK